MEVLVTIEHADGMAGVVREAGLPWLSGDVSRGPSTGLERTRAGMEGLRDGSLHGGMLPQGASGARVRDGAGNTHTPAVGGGAWVLVLPEAPDAGVAVSFLDADGALVRPELPARYVREPIEDAHELCPACDGTEWELVTPDDPRHGSSSSGDGPEIPSQFLYCVACGHEERMSVVWFGVGADAEDTDPEELARWQAEWEEQRRGEHQRLLASVTFPLYAPEGMAVELGGWGGSDGEPPSEVTLFHEGLTVASAPRDRQWQSLEQQAAQELIQLMGDPLEAWPERSDAGLTLWLRAREREQASAAAKAEHVPRDLLVDGIAVPFAVAHAGDRWVAAGIVGKVQLTVTARDVPIEAVRLRALADPTRLDGGFVPLRAQRDALDPMRVVDLAQGTPLEDIAGELAALARPGLRLVAVDGPAAAGATKLGGRPDLPAGSTWPLGAGEDQDPLTFFGQLALADLDPAVWPGPRSGLLSVFLAFEVEYYGIDRSGAAHLVHTPAGTSLAPLAFPAALPAELHLPEEPVQAVAQLTMPGVSVEPAMPLEPFGFSYGEPRADQTDALHELTTLLTDEHDRRPERARMLGWPTLVQGDTLFGLVALGVGPDHARAAYVDWALLLQTEIDGVGIYVGLPIADLATGRFDRAQATAEHT